MRVLFVAHGYPPRETAGTERHTHQLAAALRARGHETHVLAATRAPGRRQYETLREPGITRIVNNVPTRPLAQAERDRSIEAISREVEDRFVPDVVHVHHVQFLSAGMRFRAPVVITLHDLWAWCAAGGTGLMSDGSVCPGPSPEHCAPCHAAWRPIPGRAARSLVATAGVMAPFISPDRLHAVYKKVPARWRARVHRDRSETEPPAAAGARNTATLDFYRRADARIAPSRYLAELAEARGTGPVEVVPHGIPSEPRLLRQGGGAFVFIGTIARHKGPDLVVRAWKRAFPDGDPPLTLHGPIIDPIDHPVSSPLDRAGVFEALSTARALVMGSVWPENAPLILLEARAAGCPVIAPAIGGIPELVEHGVDGLLYPPGDEVALSEAMRDPPVFRPRPPRALAQQVDEIIDLYSRLRP